VINMVCYDPVAIPVVTSLSQSDPTPFWHYETFHPFFGRISLCL
jgi:hypothetical protein